MKVQPGFGKKLVHELALRWWNLRNFKEALESVHVFRSEEYLSLLCEGLHEPNNEDIDHIESILGVTLTHNAVEVDQTRTYRHKMPEQSTPSTRPIDQEITEECGHCHTPRFLHHTKCWSCGLMYGAES